MPQTLIMMAPNSCMQDDDAIREIRDVAQKLAARGCIPDQITSISVRDFFTRQVLAESFMDAATPAPFDPSRRTVLALASQSSIRTQVRLAQNGSEEAAAAIGRHHAVILEYDGEDLSTASRSQMRIVDTIKPSSSR